jgi:transposase
MDTRLGGRYIALMNTPSRATDAGNAPVEPAEKPRFQRPERQQMEWKPRSLDQMVPADHPARAVWAFVESLDLGPLYDQIRAVEGHVGRPPIDPRILLALWLYATIEGVSHARRLDRLCREHLAYQWLCGGVTVNYHTLADFRVQHVEFLDQLLTQSVAALLAQGLVSLQRVGQDGMRVRASAGASSFARRPTLEQALIEAEAQIAALKREAEEKDASAAGRRQQAAEQRAARERAERTRKALEQLPEIQQKMERRKKGSSETARASTTDPDARRMKMADGGFRPAYNVQFVTAAESLVIVGADVTNAGSDRGLMAPLADQVQARHGQSPQEYLADGGFATTDDIDALQARGTTVYTPIKEEDRKRRQGQDPFAPRPGDSPAVAAWRQRMGTESAKATYKQRAPTAEFPNAGCRNRGLIQFVVRGLRKTKAIALWHALAHNLQRTLALRAAAGLALF